MKINFFNKSTRKISQKLKKTVEEKIKSVSKILDCPDIKEINIIFIKPVKIQELNKKFFQRNCTTDVISFKCSIPIKDSRVLGDIIICPEVALKNSKKYNTDFDSEIKNLAIHGFVHLFDFDHLTKEEKIKWEKIFKKIKNVVK